MTMTAWQQQTIRTAGADRRSAFRRWRTSAGIVLVVAVSVAGCKELTGSQTLPAGVSNPSTYNTVAGALGQRNAAVKAFIDMLPAYVLHTGMLTDEFVGLSGQGRDPLDDRTLPASSPTLNISASTDADYFSLNQVRAFATQAIGQLATYDPSASPALRGELYALDGYTEVLLADLFCSGIPLSSVNFQKDYTYKPGSTTAQVYQDAIAKFDSALSLSQDSAPILYLAAVGKGRALLDVGQYAEAAQAVATVPDTFQYQLFAQMGILGTNGTVSVIPQPGSVGDREGENGLPFVSSHDPRSQSTSHAYAGEASTLVPNRILNTLNSAGFAPVTIADGIEARLIQAEGALHSGDTATWLGILNQLRASAVVQATGQPEPGQLPQLTMPANDTARVALMFSERAFWLFATGHRQGDLRRQIRQYQSLGFTQQTVYPTGVYVGGGFYGGDVTAPIPGAEYVNPLFHGCIDRNA